MRSRRRFTRDLALAGAAVAARPLRSLAQSPPSERVVVAVMGVHGRGRSLARQFAAQPNAEVGWVCDVDERYAEACQAAVEKVQGRRPRAQKDVRRLLEERDVDAVVVATPDHWHAPAALMAVAAGKHVYLEKPCGHNPREGELLIEAEKKHRRIIQMGSQRRSWPGVKRAMAALHSGIIGRVYFAKGWYANNRESIGFGQETPVPDQLDYDLWQGPAPRTPYRDNIHPYNWHWFRRWGTGEALNNGTHEIDVMRWGMGVDYPSRVVASGGRYRYRDDWEFPDTMVASFEFDDGRCITWEGRSCNNHPIEGMERGVVFHGEKGTMVQLHDGYTVYANDRERTVIEHVESGGDSSNVTDTTSPDAALDKVHVAAFLTRVREGKLDSSPIAEGHKSVLLCHLANIAWRSGRVLTTDKRNGHILGDPEAMALWGREYEQGWEPVV